ncbi:hypothetical protein PR003_g15335 [Phytophthora rubi]|uniref:Uncharacterized protein n=1 Tax=Phytophthora rubi TaxID=129364 RepID=A0A6A4EQY8_9STRA|nr:hypothetical protein PR003_g15335 [Phytophthora rubi]
MRTRPRAADNGGECGCNAPADSDLLQCQIHGARSRKRSGGYTCSAQEDEHEGSNEFRRAFESERPERRGEHGAAEHEGMSTFWSSFPGTLENLDADGVEMINDGLSERSGLSPATP